MDVLMLLFIVLLALALCNAIYIIDSKNNRNSSNVTMSILIVVFIILAFATYCNKPKAIDVYRGKTELKITGKLKNGMVVPYDTLVVYKK